MVITKSFISISSSRHHYVQPHTDCCRSARKQQDLVKQLQYELAGEMLDRVGRFLKHYGEVGRALSKAQHAYEEGEKKLTLGSQSIVRTCGKLERLGAKQSNKNPIPQLEDDYESYDGQEA